MMEPWYEDLAHRLCAAYVSHVTGAVGVDATLKICREEHPHPGSYWMQLAERIELDLLPKTHEALHAPASLPEKPTDLRSN